MDFQLVQLKDLCSMEVGGPGQLVALGDEADVKAFNKEMAQQPFSILAGGSNIIFPDTPWPLPIAQLSMAHLEASEGVVRAGAGLLFDALVDFSVEKGWAGLECLSGIPGHCGAAPIQNVGAYGQELSQVLVEVRAWDRYAATFVNLSHAQCEFDYRSSIFKRKPGRYMITEITLKLRPGSEGCTSYADLKGLESKDLKAIRDKVLAVRGDKGMVLNSRDPWSRGCGSFFTNPILTPLQYRNLCHKLPSGHPFYDLGDQIKIPAAYLIEKAGFHKGQSFGPVSISEKHALALVNLGSATYEDVYRAAQVIRDGVFAVFEIRLEPEPNLMGGWL